MGLPQNCDLPTKVSLNTFDYRKVTCQPTKDQIKQIKFDGKSDGGPTTIDDVKLYIHKVHDSQTFPEGYKFTFHPLQDVEISKENKLIKDVWWDFRLKQPEEGTDEFVLERVWKNTEELLKAVGLTCTEDTCTIENDSLKLKSGIDFMMKGKWNSESTGTLKIEKKKPGHYEGLRFSVQGGDITVENSVSPHSTIKMKEMEIFHIRKEDSRGTYHVLARKHNLWEMIPYHLGLNAKDCYLLFSGKSKECIIEGKTTNNPLEKIKFHDGSGEHKITGNSDNSLIINIESVDGEDYPYGYKFSITSDSGSITVGGSITLSSSTPTVFKIKKGEGTKLHLEKVD